MTLRLIKPSWNLVAQNIVQDFASASRAALNQLVSNCNPATWVTAVRDLRHPRQRNRAEATQSTRHSEPAVDVNLRDPAYSAIQSVTSYLAGLHVIINGGNGIDWEKARGDGTVAGAEGGITFLAMMLQDFQQDFRGISTGGKASVTFTRILETSVRVSTPRSLRVANVSYPSTDRDRD